MERLDGAMFLLKMRPYAESEVWSRHMVVLTVRKWSKFKYYSSTSLLLILLYVAQPNDAEAPSCAQPNAKYRGRASALVTTAISYLASEVYH